MECLRIVGFHVFSSVDVIEYISTDASISMDTDGIAWSYDEDKK